jgi:hypothetical protein
VRCPGLGLQMFMVVLVIAFQMTVTALLDKPSTVDTSKIKIEKPQMDLPPLDFSEPQKESAGLVCFWLHIADIDVLLPNVRFQV